MKKDQEGNIVSIKAFSKLFAPTKVSSRLEKNGVSFTCLAYQNGSKMTGKLLHS